MREAEAALSWSLPEMLDAYRSVQADGRIMVVRLEDFMASSESFDATVQRIYNFTVGDIVSKDAVAALTRYAAREDLRRRPWTDHSTSILNPQLKRDAALALSSIPQDVLKQLLIYRHELGYGRAS
mmetsp:Transcript_144055/g.447415  ORF Transcript_144055/g.447415 Transcript_144055/m.447415 type:complete len:126 (+) Transcript_144055:94-471(+)